MLRKFVVPMILVLILTMATFSSVFADDGSIEPLTPVPEPAGGEMVNETPQLWFVELSGVPTADGGSLAAVKAEKNTFRANAKKAGLVYTEKFAFNTLFNGFSISVTADQLGKLGRIPGVKNIYPVETIAPPEPGGEVNPELFTSITMIGADIAQSELGFTGKGVKVGVIDTGIDYDHQGLGGDGVARSNSTVFPTARVIKGWDFVGDAYNEDSTSPNYNPVPVPDPYPDDCAGHGSHVAGIIGANDSTNGLKGVAPEVSFGAYRVFGCAGSTSGDIMIAAMERALADGMQVVNMSIGSAYQWPQYPTAMAATRLVNKGVVVVASIGNNGANGLYAAGAPGLGTKVIGVASYDNIDVFLPYFTVNDRNIGYMTMTFSANPPVTGTEEIVYIGQACNADTLLADPAGKAALAVRGTCSFAEKALRAINAGATSVVIYNNVSGVVAGTLGSTIGSSVPVVGISRADGLFIRAQIAPITMTWTDLQGSFPSPTGGLISSFSSYGLSPDLTLKPDLGAPGGNIYSTYPLELGGYATMSGTSMSSPHVAGAVALLLQAKPKTSPQLVRDILQNSAVPALWSLGPSYGLLDNVHRQGAGMIQIDKAILATTMITPGKISAGEGAAGPYTQKLTITNKATAAVTYDLSYENAISTGGTITPSFYGSDAEVTFNVNSIKVPAGGTATVNAKIYPASGPADGQYGGYIVFTPQGGGQVYSVPFAGFVGDYQGIQVLAPTPYGFPWLAVLYGGSYYQVTDPTDWTYTMQGEDVPYFLVHFEHQAQTLQINIFAETGKDWHFAYKENYLPRNASGTGFFALPFDGTTFAGKILYTVPDGTYYAVISVLKANGNAANPADWETWTSPLFVIDRP